MHILKFYNRADKYILGVLLEGGLELGIFFFNGTQIFSRYNHKSEPFRAEPVQVAIFNQDI